MSSSGSNLLLETFYRHKAVEYIQHWIGTPYSWGGDDFSSFDCSGLVVEVLKSIGKFYDHEDYSAHMLYHKYKSSEVKTPFAGCLILWFNKEGRAVHVGMMIDKYFLVHASGGGSKVKTVSNAIDKNAYVMMRELRKVAKFRKGHYGQDYKVVDPFELKKKIRRRL